MADIRLGRTFYSGFSAESTISADMVNFRRLAGLSRVGDIASEVLL